MKSIAKEYVPQFHGIFQKQVKTLISHRYELLVTALNSHSVHTVENTEFSSNLKKIPVKSTFYKEINKRVDFTKYSFRESEILIFPLTV